MKKVKVPELFRTVPLPKMTKEKVQVTREVEMHEYTCAVVSVLILCFFLVLRIFWEEQLAEQFWYFNFSSYLVVFWAEQ